MSWAQEDRQAMADRMLYRERDRLTVGADSFHAMDPAEMLMALEEAEADPAARLAWERQALRREVFSGFREYLFADGPEPARVRERIEGALQSFAPQVLPRMKGQEVWVPPAEVGRVLDRHARKLAAVREAHRSRAALSTWWGELCAEEDVPTVAETLAGIIEFLLSEGTMWRTVTSVAYCLAKALSPELIAGMSLEDIARLSGDHGGRATPSARIKRLYNRRLEQAGMMGTYLHYQKSATTVARYAAAQVGNDNRAGKGRRRRNRRRRKG